MKAKAIGEQIDPMWWKLRTTKTKPTKTKQNNNNKTEHSSVDWEKRQWINFRAYIPQDLQKQRRHLQQILAYKYN